MEKNKQNTTEKKSLLKEAEKINQQEQAAQNERVKRAGVRESYDDEIYHDETIRGRRLKRREHHHKHYSPFGAILTKIIIILVLVLIFLTAGYFAFSRMMTVKTEVKHAMVEKELSYCQELVVLKYRYTDVVSLKKAVALSKSYSIVKYTGIVRAGIKDMSQCDYEISWDGKSIKVLLPEAEILGNEIISQEVFDESHSVFVDITLDEVFAEIDKNRDKSLEDLLDEGILEEAHEYSKKLVRQMLLSAGFEEVIVE